MTHLSLCAWGVCEFDRAVTNKNNLEIIAILMQKFF